MMDSIATSSVPRINVLCQFSCACKIHFRPLLGEYARRRIYQIESFSEWIRIHCCHSWSVVMMIARYTSQSRTIVIRDRKTQNFDNENAFDLALCRYVATMPFQIGIRVHTFLVDNCNRRHSPFVQIFSFLLHFKYTHSQSHIERIIRINIYSNGNSVRWPGFTVCNYVKVIRDVCL